MYFPNRAHAVRIALKKLRYAMEIAHETGFGDRSAAQSGSSKKAQDVLGDLHDRQELIDNLVECAGDGAEVAAQISLLKQVIDAEIHDLHGRYLARRHELQEICHRQSASVRGKRPRARCWRPQVRSRFLRAVREIPLNPLR